MLDGSAQRAGLWLTALCAAALAWAVASAAPAHASARCDQACHAAKKQKLALLRAKNAQQKRPNVVVIDTDDMNVTDLSVMRNTLRLLTAHGTTFQNSYVSYPLCCPSRATFLTGQYAHNNHVLTDQRYGDLNNTNTLAVWLRRAKYRTAMVGKYLNGYGVIRPREIPPGWSKWFALTDGTEQHRYGFKLNENGKVRHYSRKPANYIDYVLDSKVNGLLKKWAISPKPFFLYYNPNNPHGESGTPVWSTRDPEPAPQYARCIRRHHGTAPTELRRAQRLRQAGGGPRPTPAIRCRARGHRQALSRPAGEPALRRRRGQEDRQAGPQIRRQAEDLLHLHLRQRADDGRTPDRVQGLPLPGGRAGPPDHPRPGLPAEHHARPDRRERRPGADDHGAHRCTPRAADGRDPPAAAGQGPCGRDEPRAC